MVKGSGISQEQAVWSAPDSLDFYSSHRQTPDDLYPSERYFLPEAARAAATCLDIGCAAGGFSRIMKSFNPALAYTGVDITPEFIRRAKSAFPDSSFEVGNGVAFSTPPNSYDLVFSSGILHVNSHYQDIVRAAYAQARGLLLCDFRLTWGPDVVGRFRVNFDESSRPSAQADLPYLVLNVDRLVTELRALQPAPRSVTIRGYYHAPAASADLPLSRVLMAFARIEKGRVGDSTTVTVDLPREENERA
jgi:SAM-dependent methyltransferase